MGRRAASIADYRALAKARLPHFLFEYIDGGAYDEVTLARNIAELRATALRQRALRDVSAIDTTTSLFGTDYALPVGLGPVGLAGMYARRGEVQAARAAKDAGVPMVLSTVSACGLAEVAASGLTPWYQLYFVKDRGAVAHMVDQAEAMGCDTLVLTVDLGVPGSRYRDARAVGTKFDRLLQLAARPGWLWDVGINGRPHSLGNLEEVVGKGKHLDDFQAWIHANFDASVSWADLDWLRGRWKGKLVVKGILDPDDARESVARGADGIVVSNHGGRQLDGALSSAAALPRCAAAVAGKAAILVDGGVRSGLDVARMLALGADFVLLGRAWAYALAAGGGNEVRRMLRLVEAELRVAMALTGVTRIGDIDAGLIDRG